MLSVYTCMTMENTVQTKSVHRTTEDALAMTQNMYHYHQNFNTSYNIELRQQFQGLNGHFYRKDRNQLLYLFHGLQLPLGHSPPHTNTDNSSCLLCTD